VSNVPRGTKLLARDLHQDELLNLIDEGLAELGLPRDPEMERRLLRLTDLLASWAPRVNLTGHRDPETILRRLVLDAAALVPHLPSFSTLADIGSGAGFPGFPLVILHPRARLTSIEPRSKRAYFQRAVARELELANVEVKMARSQDLAPTPHDLVIAQAFAPPAKALGSMLPWARPGGWIAIPTGLEVAVDEFASDSRIEDFAAHRYRVPLGGAEHQLLLARRAT